MVEKMHIITSLMSLKQATDRASLINDGGHGGGDGLARKAGISLFGQ